MIRVELTIEPQGSATAGEPVACGLPFPRGALLDAASIALFDAAGEGVPVQMRVLDRWSDGSIRWLLLRWAAPTRGGEKLMLATRGTSPVVAVAPALEIDASEAAVRVRAGAYEYRIERGAGFPLSSVAHDSIEQLDPSSSRFLLADSANRTTVAHVRSFEVEERGPLYSRIRVEGEWQSSFAAPILVWARLHFHAASAAVRVEVGLRNRRPARHRGGYWELGDPGSFLIRQATLTLGSRATTIGSIVCSPEPTAPLAAYDAPFELFQASSGGENWRSRVHVDASGTVPFELRGYRIRARSETRSGERAEPIVGLRAGETSIAVGVPKLWANFPKAIDCDGRVLALHLFPPQSLHPHELQGGEQKTHTAYLSFAPDGAAALGFCRRPLRVRADPEWYAASDAVPSLVTPAKAARGDYEALIESAIDGPESFFAKRERIDEFGWRNFGDLHADHEERFSDGPKPIVSHYNNQYDAVGGLLRQFLRSGDFRWWDLAGDLAEHVADIDVYHADGDKAAYDHGLFWHTLHYTDAGKSTHRSYPRSTSASGGPSNEHNYTTGLVLHHFLTGSPSSRETALELARWVVDMDDGRRTIFRWLARGATGHASQTAELAYHGPGRGLGNSVNALLDAFQLTRDRAWLETAESLLHRCHASAPEPATLDLGNPERRWSYVVHLQVLARYLEVKEEMGERDRRFREARTYLLRFARWMVEHEYFYLDRPDRLEFPTETWAAHEVRKADVLVLAARHAARHEERRRFSERARFFFDEAMSRIASMETRTRTRPLVILIGNGAAYLARWSGIEDGPLETDNDAPLPLSSTFVPQRRVAIRRAKGIALASCSALAVAAFTWWLRG